MSEIEVGDADFDEFGGFEAADPSEMENYATVSTGPSEVVPINLSAAEDRSDNCFNKHPVGITEGLQSLECVMSTSASQTPASLSLQSQLPWVNLAVNGGPTSLLDCQPSHQSVVKIESSVEPLSQPNAAGVHNEQGSPLASVQTVEWEHEILQSQQEMKLLKTELVDLSLKLRDSSIRNDDLAEQIRNQKDKYEELQKRHAEELFQLKEASHKALAIIVEEYKEMCKLAVLESEKTCRIAYDNFLKEQVKKYDEALIDQAHQFKQQRESDEKQRAETSLKLGQSLTEELQRTVEQEKMSLRDQFVSLEVSLREAQMSAKSELDTSIDSKLATALTKLDHACGERIDKKVVELEQKAQAQVRAAVDSERDSCLEFWTKHSEKTESAVRQSINSAAASNRTSIETYVEQRLAADKLTQKRHLAAVTLFLESARQQISSLEEDVTS